MWDEKKIGKEIEKKDAGKDNVTVEKAQEKEDKKDLKKSKWC